MAVSQPARSSVNPLGKRDRLQIPVTENVGVRERGPYINPFEKGEEVAKRNFGSIGRARTQLSAVIEQSFTEQRRAGVKVGSLLVITRHIDALSEHEPLGAANLGLVVAKRPLSPRTHAEVVCEHRKPYPLMLGCPANLWRIGRTQVHPWRTSPVDRIWAREDDGQVTLRFLTRNGSIYEVLAVCDLPTWHVGDSALYGSDLPTYDQKRTL